MRHNAKRSTLLLAGVVALLGSADPASAGKPEKTTYKWKGHGAEFYEEGEAEGGCLRYSVDFSGREAVLDYSDTKPTSDSGVFAGVYLWDKDDGILIGTLGIDVPGDFTGDLEEAEASITFTADVMQCAPDPTCDSDQPVNCYQAGTRLVSVAATWDGFGALTKWNEHDVDNTEEQKYISYGKGTYRSADVSLTLEAGDIELDLDGTGGLYKAKEGFIQIVHDH